MSTKESFKVGDSVRHRDRKYYQKGVVMEVEEGCNGGLIVAFEDGFYGTPDEGRFSKQDILKTLKS